MGQEHFGRTCMVVRMNSTGIVSLATTARLPLKENICRKTTIDFKYGSFDHPELQLQNNYKNFICSLQL